MIDILKQLRVTGDDPNALIHILNNAFHDIEDDMWAAMPSRGSNVPSDRVYNGIHGYFPEYLLSHGYLNEYYRNPGLFVDIELRAFARHSDDIPPATSWESYLL